MRLLSDLRIRKIRKIRCGFSYMRKLYDLFLTMQGISGSVLLIIFRSLISLIFITCLIHISLNLKNDQKNRPHDPIDLRIVLR